MGCKIAVLVYHMLLTTLVLMGTTSPLIYHRLDVPWREILAASASVDCCSAQISIQLSGCPSLWHIRLHRLGVAGLVGGVVAHKLRIGFICPGLADKINVPIDRRAS